MGEIEQIEQLETYINDLGDEIGKVKKASEYLKLIEQFQAEIKSSALSLNQSKDQLKIMQEIVESKLELFHATTKNIDAKQQALEQTQTNIIVSLTDLKKQLDKNEKGIISSFKEINSLYNQNQKKVLEEIKHTKENQQALINGMIKTNKVFFVINAVLSISIVGILINLLAR